MTFLAQQPEAWESDSVVLGNTNMGQRETVLNNFFKNFQHANTMRINEHSARQAYDYDVCKAAHCL